MKTNNKTREFFRRFKLGATAFTLIVSMLVFVLLSSVTTVFGEQESFKDFNYPAQFGWDGYPDGSFHPDEMISRAEFVCYLYKIYETLREEYKTFLLHEEAIEIKPIKEYNNSFSDVSSESWYYEYVVWAYERCIINGVGDGKFDPESTINVFDYAIMMKRFYDSAFSQDWESRTRLFVYAKFALGCTYDDNWVGGNNYDLANDKDRDEQINRISQSDLPGWFTAETSLDHIIGIDIWIGGQGKIIDISRFSPTRGEIYKHSHALFIGYHSS